MTFEPDYRNMLDVLANRKPRRLPVYEHLISTDIMEKVLGIEFQNLIYGNNSDRQEFFKQYCRFFKENTCDTVSFEFCITSVLPDNGAIMGGKPGPIQNRENFIKYPWEEIPILFWQAAKPQFDLLGSSLPNGMKAVGGIGNGVLEICEDLVGFEYLSYMMFEDPELFGDIFCRVGDLMLDIWTTFINQHKDSFAIMRFGDDLGFRSSTLISPQTIRKFILPQYKKIIDLVHSNGFPFLLHSCGNIFSIMEDVIELGIDAKHSNEDAIAPFEEWINLYGDRIGLLGGIDVDLLCLEKPNDVFEKVVDLGSTFRKKANGYALGSGNSIPDYVPVEGYLAMIKAARKIRENESN